MFILHISGCKFDAGTQIEWAFRAQIIQAELAFDSCSRLKLYVTVIHDTTGYAKAVSSSVNCVNTHLVGVVIQQPLPQK